MYGLNGNFNWRLHGTQFQNYQRQRHWYACWEKSAFTASITWHEPRTTRYRIKYHISASAKIWKRCKPNQRLTVVGYQPDLRFTYRLFFRWYVTRYNEEFTALCEPCWWSSWWLRQSITRPDSPALNIGIGAHPLHNRKANRSKTYFGNAEIHCNHAVGRIT